MSPSLRGVQMYRVMWLYAALHGFAGAGQGAAQYRWPAHWRLALGQLACVTPTLLPASPPEVSAARLKAELSERLIRPAPRPAGAAALKARSAYTPLASAPALAGM